MAHWIIEDKGFSGLVFNCSNCGASWNDIFHSGIGCWEKCPNCHEDMDEEREYLEENPLKKIADAASKLQVPKLDVKMFDVSAFDKHIQETKRRDELVRRLEEVTGMSLEELVSKFAAGYTLKEPPRAYLMDSNYKFDTELMKRQIEEFEKKRNSEWPYWGRGEFEKRQGEESLKDMLRRAGCFGEKLIYDPLVVNIDFDKKMREQSDGMLSEEKPEE